MTAMNPRKTGRSLEKVMKIDGELTGDEEHVELHFVKELEDKSRSKDRQVGIEEQL
jgi:hypothetical protein